MTLRSRLRSWPHGLAATGWWALPLRLMVGYGFMAHGLAKLSRGPGAFAGVLHALGVPAPDVMAPVTIFVEITGGLLIGLGAFVWAVAIPLAAVLGVAAITVHLPYGFSSIKLVAVTGAGAQFGPPGYEVAVLYLACLAALVMGGPGPFSIDGLIAQQRASAPGAGAGGTRGRVT